MSKAQYFVSSTTRALLRRQDGADRAYVNKAWQPTDTIAEYMIGEEDNVSPVTEAEARKLEPSAF